MAQVLKIVDWDELFETHNTRKVKRLELIYFRNRHDGDGYTELVEHTDGAAHFGAWIGMCELHSRVRNIFLRRSGVLLRDDGRPHDAASLGRMTRMGREVFEEALPRLGVIGWVVLVELNQQSPVDPPSSPGDPPLLPDTPGDFGSPTNTNTKTKPNPKTLKTREEKPDPLAAFPVLSEFYPKLILIMKDAFGEREFKPPKDDRPWRDTLAKLIEPDGYSEGEVVECLTWLYIREDQSGDFSWRLQAQSIAALRKKKKGDSMSKFAKINTAFSKARSTSGRPMKKMDYGHDNWAPFKRPVEE